MTYEEEKKLLANYRGRRLLACRAADTLRSVIDALGEEDGSCLPIPGKAFSAPPSKQLKDELNNLVTSALRIILSINDGELSGSRLQPF